MASVSYVAHVAGFGLAALTCLAVLGRTRSIEDADTRRGLYAFVLSSAAWAAAHVGYLVAPGAGAKYVFYSAGLVVGFWTVFPWLYFCSAFAGRSFHRTPALRRAALGLVAVVAGLKLTNPIHGWYFDASMQSAPFGHLAVETGLIHWLVLGLAYVLAAVGFFLLFELFAQAGQSVRPLVVLTALFGAPLALNVLGATTGSFLEMTYEPLGVAAFAVGVTAVYDVEFRTVRLAGEHDDPVVVLTDDGRVRDYNAAAAEAFAPLGSGAAVGRPLADVVPAFAAQLEDGVDLATVDDGRRRRDFQVTTTRPGTSPLGRIVRLTDVTERESYRRELERQNERLEQFASVVSHDLRNPLTVAQGRLEMVRAECEDENLDRVADALGRMDELIDDVLALARQGESIDEPEPVALADVVADAWTHVDTGDATLDVAVDATVLADPERLQQLFENLFRNAAEHGGDAVTVGALADGFFVADDGPGVPPEDRERVFESGVSTADDGTGFGLAIVAEIVAAHDWSIAVTESETGGARFEVTGVEATD